MIKFSSATAIASCWRALVGIAPAQAATDTDAAQALFKKNDCAKCHTVDKSKKGPSLKKIAAKLRAENQDKVMNLFSSVDSSKIAKNSIMIGT